MATEADTGALERASSPSLRITRLAAALNGLTRPTAAILPRLRTRAMSGMRCKQGIPNLEIVEPLGRNRLTRQSAVVDHRGVRDCRVLTHSSFTAWRNQRRAR